MTAVVPPQKHTHLPQTSIAHVHTGITHIPETPIKLAHAHITHIHTPPSHTHTSCTHTHLYTPLRDSHLSPQKLTHVPQIKKLHSKPVLILLQMGN